MPVTELHVFSDYECFTKKHHDKTLIIDFYANWCGPCKQLAPKLTELSQDPTYESSIEVIKVNIDNDREDNDDGQQLSQIFDISSLPTVVILKNSKVIGKVVGNKIDEIKKHL